MKSILLILCLTLPLAACATAQNTAPRPDATIIRDQTEAEQLLGKHLFSEDILTTGGGGLPWFKFGSATIILKNKTYILHAAQDEIWTFRDGPESGYVHANGIITEVQPDFFRFKGTIVTYYNLYGMKKPLLCQRRGTFTFSRKQHKAYWRLQQARHTCHGTNFVDYIDLFSEHKTSTP